MKLGYIDYLNCYPFYYHMFEKKGVKDITIVSGYPSELNSGMRNAILDMSPVSSATCADISDDVFVLPDFCLSSVGYVRSVLLVSKTPIDTLDNKKVGITRASHTSVVLLKVLLEKYYKLSPQYVPAEPTPDLHDLDAALLIGNEAMIYEPPASYQVYDLGELWLKKTGFPVVFAVFTVRRDIVKKHEDKIKHVISSYHKSIKCLEDDKENLIRQAKIKYPDITYDVDTYFKLLEFNFAPELKKALSFYHETAGELGLIKKVTRLKYLEI